MFLIQITIFLLFVSNCLISFTFEMKKITIEKKIKFGLDKKYMQWWPTTHSSIFIPKLYIEFTQLCLKFWSGKFLYKIRTFLFGIWLKLFTTYRRTLKLIKLLAISSIRNLTITKSAINHITISALYLSLDSNLNMRCRFIVVPYFFLTSPMKKCYLCLLPSSVKKLLFSSAKYKQWRLYQLYFLLI
mgnify:CR=1 FL=1